MIAQLLSVRASLPRVNRALFKCAWYLLGAELTEDGAFSQAPICSDERAFAGMAARQPREKDDDRERGVDVHIGHPPRHWLLCI